MWGLLGIELGHWKAKRLMDSVLLSLFCKHCISLCLGFRGLGWDVDGGGHNERVLEEPEGQPNVLHVSDESKTTCS